MRNHPALSSFTALHIGYFAVAFVEIVSEFFKYDPAIVILKPAIPFLLMILYYFSSTRRNIIFFVTMFFSMLTNLFFIANSEQMLLFGSIAFLFHRIFIILFIIRLVNIKDFIPTILATIPILLIFSYLLSITSEVPENQFWLMMMQNILIAILGGIAFSVYLVDDNKENSLLALCGLLFVALQFIVFIERYYLSGMSPLVFRPIAMTLNASAFYLFYRFAVAKENVRQ